MFNMKIISRTTNKPHIYKIVCIPTGEYYYGVHNGNNTSKYTGSGKLLKSKINKYGLDNFTKEILLTFDTIEEAYEYEAVIVNKKTIRKNNPKSLNLSEGGKGFTSEAAVANAKAQYKKMGVEGQKEFALKGVNAINAKLKAEGRKTEVGVKAGKLSWEGFNTSEERSKESKRRQSGITHEQRVATGKLSWEGFNTPEERSKEIKRRQSGVSKEQRVAAAKKGAIAAAKSPKGMNNVKKQCPHCPMACNPGLYSRFHGDMCKHNPLSVRYKGVK